MLNTPLKPIKPVLVLGLLALAVSQPLLADDTEIYIGNDPNISSTPAKVMFHIDYVSNLAREVCGDSTTTDTGVDVTRDNIETTCPKIKDTEAGYDYSLYMLDSDFEDGKVDLYEMLRASLKRVLMPLENVEVGIILPHANNNNCVGPYVTGCSNGAYILHNIVPFRDLPDSVADLKGNFDAATQADIDAIRANDPNKDSLLNQLEILPAPHGNYAHAAQYKEVYFELFRYLTGQLVFNGHNGWNDFGTGSDYNLGGWGYQNGGQRDYACAADFTCSTSGGDASEYIDGGGNWYGDFATPDNQSNYLWTGNFKWDVSAEMAPYYRSPLGECSKVYVINILNGTSNQQNDSDEAIAAPLTEGGMGLADIENGNSGFAQVVEWMYKTDLADAQHEINGILADGTAAIPLDFADKQNVTSYFLALQPQQVNDAASVGSGGLSDAFALDGASANEITQKIENIFSNVISVSTTFVAASIPVNVFNRSDVLDNAYLALFEADDTLQPAWVGNVKKLKLDVVAICKAGTVDPDTNDCADSDKETQLHLVDTAGADAIATDGRISANALTFWTDAAGYDLYEGIDGRVDGKDGRAVNRGGAGQQIPDFLSDTLDGTTTPSTYPAGAVTWENGAEGRQIYTEDNGSLIDLDYTSASTLWPSIYDGSTYVQDHWPTLYDSNGNTVNYSGTTSDLNYYTQDPTVADTSCKTSHHTAGTGVSTCSSKQDFTAFKEYMNLLAYIRGFKVDFSDDDANLTTGDTRDLQTRRWIFGDPLHSRPIPINYGARSDDGYSEDNPDIRIILGSNDGFLRMIKNTGGGESAPESGEEQWAFMPREVMPIQKELMNNRDNSLHPYGVDGPVSAYIRDANGTINDETGGTDADADGVIDEVNIFFGLRRGGRHYYAMDITNPDNPPVFEWKVGPETTGFSEIGYTFAQPVVREIIVEDAAGNPEPRTVLIVGGGYSLNKDDPADNSTQVLGTDDAGSGDTAMGNAVYVIDAQSGELIWKASGTDSTAAGYDATMVDSIPSRVAAVDGDGDGYVDQAYVGDTGGSVWRMDFYGADPSTWEANKLLNVGRHDTDGANLQNDRRFFHAPDVVPARDETGRFFAVVIGSGNRAHPTQLNTDDYLFMYKDRCMTTALSDCSSFSGTAAGSDDLYDATENCDQEINSDSCPVTATELAKKPTGWKMALIDEGEKSLASPLTVRGVVYFSTYLPASSSDYARDIDGNSCGPEEGSGYQYVIALGDARALINYDTTNTETDGEGETHELQVEDRRRELDSGGIPAENVYVSYTDEETGLEYHGILSPDLKPGADLGTQYWRSYWMEKNK